MSKSSAGFTLLEILTVVFIVVTMTSLVMVNQRESQKKFTLRTAAHQLAQDVRRAQEMAMSARECPECGGGIPPNYGIFLDKSSNNQYIIYADTDPAEGDEFYTSSSDTIIETIELEEGVVIEDINTSSYLVSVNYKPPDPKITIKYQELGGEINSVIITLALESDSSETKTITINNVGLIDID
ncbi:MAG: hypothetical protein IB617_00260 [Candidatus Nealsonbacteria bacterium]|nr:MAG: hypothetical protein IB617_00260 [Candidatus Nealsonbacteria bacterium]